MLPLGESFLSYMPTNTSLASIIWIYFNQLLISVFNFITQHSKKRTPTNILDLFTQKSFRQAQKIQLFYDNNIVFFDKLSRKFMLKINSAIFYLLMKHTEFKNGFFSIFRAFLFPINTSLFSTKFFERRFIEFEIFHLCTVRKRDEIFNSCVNTNMFTCFWQWGFRCFNRKNCKPLSTLILYCQSFDLTFNPPRKFKFHCSDFGKGKPISRQRKSSLGVAERIKSIYSFKTRITYFLIYLYTIEEICKRSIKTFQNILQNLTINFFIIRVILFNFRKLLTLGVIINFNLIYAKSVPPFLKCRIIKKPAKLESFYKLNLNRFIRFANTKLKSSFNNCFGHNKNLIRNLAVSDKIVLTYMYSIVIIPHCNFYCHRNPLNSQTKSE
jgi:hypothetical protein